LNKHGFKVYELGGPPCSEGLPSFKAQLHAGLIETPRG